jgi:hypothetical protein
MEGLENSMKMSAIEAVCEGVASFNLTNCREL